MSTKNVKSNGKKSEAQVETATKTTKAATKTTTSKAKTTTAQEKKTETTAKAAKTTTPEQEKKTSDTVKMVGLVKTLRSVLDDVAKRDSALADKIKKALKSKTTKLETLDNLVKEVVALGNKPVVANEEKPATTSKKGGITRVKTETTDKKETTKSTKKSEEKKSTTTKSKAKTEPKKAEKEKPAVKSIQSTGDLKAPMATLFPDTITTEIDGVEMTLTRAEDDDFPTIADITEAMTEEGKIVMFACYWTKRHIKEFNYGIHFKVAAPKAFKNDLDLAIAVVDCPNTKRIWAMSKDTEAMYYFEETDLEPVEDVNPYNGEKYTLRVSNGMEFAIYVADAPED